MRHTLAFCLLLPLAGAAMAAAPPPSGAAQGTSTRQQMAELQTQMNDLARQMAALSTRLGDEANASALHYLADGRHGMFGMAVHATTDGLRVDAVTPGGPAERAGLTAGDTITAVDGKSLSPKDASALTRLANLPAGKPVRMDASRNGKTRHVTVTPERLQASDWRTIARQAELAANQAAAQVRSPQFQRQIQQSVDAAMKSAAAAMRSASVARQAAIQAGAHGNRWLIRASPWFGLNLAPLNPDLGRYFGADRGALVLSRDDQQFPQLQPGDVITAVGGQPVAQPEDALRALRDAAHDKPVTVLLRRHDKAVTLAMKVPTHWEILPPPPPVPPVPPAPKSVAPPAPPPPPAPPRT